MSGRPGSIVRDIRVELPRPRSLEVKRTAEFKAYEDEVWHLIAQNYLQQILYGAALLVAVLASTLIRRAASRSS